MRRLPDCVVITSIGTSMYAKREALSLRIPTVGIVDTNDDAFVFR